MTLDRSRAGLRLCLVNAGHRAGGKLAQAAVRREGQSGAAGELLRFGVCLSLNTYSMTDVEIERGTNRGAKG
jgi:hypothetical protein